MDSSRKYNNPSPEVHSNIISKLFFCWMLPLFKYGYKNDLEVKDLYNVPKPDLSEPLGNILEKHWHKELIKSKTDKSQPSLAKALWKTFFKQTMVLGSALFVQCIVLRMVHPLILAELINYFDPANRYSAVEGWSLAVGVVFVAFLNCMIMHHVMLQSQRIGMRCRVACCSLMYRKLLRLSKASLGKTAAGQVINLMTNDVQRFDVMFTFIHYIWIMPIQACVAAVVMYKSVGMAAIAGLLAMAVQAILLQGYLSKLQGIFRFKIAQRTDSRVKFMSEITSSIQVIKMYAWEKPFEKVVRLARKLEIAVLTKTSYIRGFMLALMVFTERFTLYLTVITYVLLGNPLTSDKVFSLAQFFNTIQLYMAIFFPLAIVSLAEAKVSVKRIRDFLLLEENATPAIANAERNEANGSVRIESGSASWIPNPIIETLTDLNLNVRPGTLCAVVGSVGSGKTSLLQLLLKELPLSSGKLEVNGEVSFASQEPWLFVSTVRNNILFGQQFVKGRYNDVVEVCALERDFEQFPQGDRTLVGERGVSLSGGQRARINMARAVYRQADIYLFDDPLSAVDTHVGNHLFEKCILKHLKDKTRILVTHQLQFLKRVDQIIIINNGQIVKVGTYNELSKGELSHLRHDQSPDDADKVTPERENPTTHKSLSAVNSLNSTQTEEEADESPETQELVEKGALSASLYAQFFRAGAGIFVLLLLGLLLIVAQASSNAADIWVTHWTNKEMLRRRKEIEINTTKSLVNETYANDAFAGDVSASTIDSLLKESRNATDYEDATDDYFYATKFNESSLTMGDVIYSTDTYIYIYTIFIVGSIVLTTMRSLLFYKICMNAAKNMHNNMFNNVLQATMRFFDTNPSGRILNRFSKDIGTIDEILPRFMLEGLQVFMVMSGILIMVFIYTPWMIVPTVLLGLVFNLCRVVYLASAQDIKRLEGITRAPAFSHVSASLSGLTTIRSSKAQYMVSKEFDILQDQHTSSWYLTLVSMETFGVYLDIICLVFLTIVTFQFLIFDDGTTMSGSVGLVISQSLILTGMLQHGMRQAAEVASNMTSVERVLQYSKIDKEGPFESTPAKKPHRDWPQKGKVKFENMHLRYVPTDAPVLKNLNVDIKAGEKVGIVGRTGAGKSSLISAIFRLAPVEGSIHIDGVDVGEIGLHDLRSKISIIPQEPVLFSASIRQNLDPFEKCDDKTLWKALEDVELKDAVEGLDQMVNEGGSNFSAGQRQLLCLARAIVRNNKILILDEATANVDPQTDALIQSTIRKNFYDCTVLTIAHRLNTIMDADKVLVMDGGEAVEFGVPHDLLQRPNGFLSQMLRETGRSMEGKLRKVAEETYKVIKMANGDIKSTNEQLDSDNDANEP